MSYTVNNLPTEFRIRSQGWTMSGGIVFQRSEFTGADRAVRLGPGARWQCEIELVPTVSLTDLRIVRSVLAIQNSPLSVYRIPAVETAQAVSPVPATCTVNGANQTGLSLAVAGLPNNTAILSAGHMISVALPNNSEQLFVITANATSNASGQATFTLGTPLRQSPANGATVRLHSPVSTMRLRPLVGWSVSPGLVYDFPAFTAEEVF